MKDFLGPNCTEVCKKVEKKLDLIFVVDGSMSLQDTINGHWMNAKDCKSFTTTPNFKKELDFTELVIDALEVDAQHSRIGFIQFAKNVDSKQQISFSESLHLGKASLKEKVSKTKWAAGQEMVTRFKPELKCGFDPSPGSGTDTPKAMRSALKTFKNEPRDAEKLLLVITDGKVQEFVRSDIVPAAAALEKLGVKGEFHDQAEIYTKTPPIMLYALRTGTLLMAIWGLAPHKVVLDFLW
jgi:hypothetical protein